MRYYETIYIVHTALDDARLKDIILSIQDKLQTIGQNEIISTEVWGKKRLAYQINKQKFGTYVLVQYKGDGRKIKEVNFELDYDINILAHMTVRIEEDEIREQSEDLESQLRNESSKSQADEGEESKDSEKGDAEKTEASEEKSEEGEEKRDKKSEEAPAEDSSEKESPAEESSEEVKEEE